MVWHLLCNLLALIKIEVKCKKGTVPDAVCLVQPGPLSLCPLNKEKFVIPHQVQTHLQWFGVWRVLADGNTLRCDNGSGESDMFNKEHKVWQSVSTIRAPTAGETWWISTVAAVTSQQALFWDKRNVHHRGYGLRVLPDSLPVLRCRPGS